MDFEVQLPLFSGPFDLLLFFIERDELDINDIPISKITKDFLNYIAHLEKLNIEVASEFILVAASLMRIKARLLVPRPELDEKNEEIDPRDELVARLLEYKKFKSVLEEFSQREDDFIKREKRGNVLKELQVLATVHDVEAEIESIDLFKIMKVFQKTVARFEDRQKIVQHQVIQYPYSISNQKQYILDAVEKHESLPFETIIKEFPDKIAVIFNFLSILELLQLNLIVIHIGEGFNNFWIKKKELEN